jgi:hypothetical protein
MQRLGDLGSVALVVEPRGQRLGEPLAFAGREPVQRGQPRVGERICQFGVLEQDDRRQAVGGADRRAGLTGEVVGGDDLIALVRGTVTWPELISSGRFELSGDPFLALRFASLFRLPVRLDPV